MIRKLGSGPQWEVWVGDHAELAAMLAAEGRRPDSLIVDAPYSARTHDGHRRGTANANRVADWAKRKRKLAQGASETRRSFGYAAWSARDVHHFVKTWAPNVLGWFVSITDHTLAPAWEEAIQGRGERLVFAPIPLVEWGGRVRLTGDGPTKWSCDIVVGRPRKAGWLRAWRAERVAAGLSCSLPGAYESSSERISRATRNVRTVGGKPVSAMRQIVRDYVPYGGLVVDPCCGSGTTGVAAIEMGTRFIGCDIDENEAKKAVTRITGAATQLRLDIDAPTLTQTNLRIE